MRSTGQVLHYQKGLFWNAQQWLHTTVCHFPIRSLFFLQHHLYIFYGLFLPYLLQKGKNRQTRPGQMKDAENDKDNQTLWLTTWVQSFQMFFKTAFLCGFPHELIRLLQELLWGFSHPHQWKCYLYVKGPFWPSFTEPFLIFWTKMTFLF